MKYCEKCGNKLKEGFLFCDKCGAKIENNEIKKKEKIVKEEKIEVRPLPPIPLRPKKKKGLTIFLTIMNILLLASTITFLILWLIKPTNKKEEKKKEKPPVENKFLGKWEQNIDYKSGSEVVQRIYEAIEIKENNSFKITNYDRDNKYSTREEYSGSYIINGDDIIITWISDNERYSNILSLKDKKLCVDYKCQNYLLLDNSTGKIVIPVQGDKKDEINTITYDDYTRIINNNDDAIIVVVQDGCHWCELFEDVVKEINKNYSTPIYYYKLDNLLGVSSTPTTLVIQDGEVIRKIIGYKEYGTIKVELDKLEVK